MLESENKIIIDTDIGEDIDDTWALVFLLSNQFIDVKLISVTTGDVKYKATLVAKILTLLNRENIPIALGVESKSETYAQKRWLNDFSLEDYKGQIYNDVKEAYKEIINKNKNIHVLGLSPFQTLSYVKDILINKNIKITAMAGSFYKGYFNSKEISPECNVVTDINAFKNVLNSSLDITLVPLDVCGNVYIKDELYKTFLKGSTTRCKIVKENYRIWDKDYVGGARKTNVNTSSTILYDLCAAWVVVFAQNFDYTKLNVYVDDSGRTLVGGNREIRVILSMHKEEFMLQASVERFLTNIESTNDIYKLGVKDMYSLTYVLHSNNVSLSVAETGWENRKPGSSFGPLEREYFILHAVVKGKGTLYIDGKAKSFKEGDCFVVPPFCQVKYTADEKDPCSYYWVGYAGIQAAEMTEKAGFSDKNNFVNTPINFKEISSRLKMMANLSSNSKAVSYYLLGQLYILFSKFLSEEEYFGSDEKNYVKKATTFIDSHYEEHITIEDIAKVVAIERTYLFRLFKKQLKMSPKDYLLKVRIEHAKKLLSSTNKPISLVANEVGYETYISFFDYFTKIVRLTPKEYREKTKRKTT